MLKNGERFRELCSVKAKQFFCDGEVYQDLASVDEGGGLCEFLFRHRGENVLKKLSKVRETIPRSAQLKMTGRGRSEKTSW